MFRVEIEEIEEQNPHCYEENARAINFVFVEKEIEEGEKEISEDKTEADQNQPERSPVFGFISRIIYQKVSSGIFAL